MAFQLPTQVPRRRTSYPHPQPSTALDIPLSPHDQPDDDTTQWVLFSPTARTQTTSTERTQTAGISRLSDFGSFGTATRSATAPEGDVDDGDALDDQLDEDGTELDSLDDGLQAFRAPSLPPTSPTRLDQGPPAMLPAHDGLGSFQASSQPVQDQLWQHEQYNPQRHSEIQLQPRRRSSVQRHLDTVDESGVDVERERWQRIEKWRMDQSRVLLQEIERETRRRRNSRVSRSSARRSVGVLHDGTSEMPKETASSDVDSETDESFWRRLTRTVIRDLIGIDDSLLCVIFGETLRSDEQARDPPPEEPLDMETVLAREPEPEHGDPPMWQTRVLQRIAHELGALMSQLCEHPGAFTTYYQMTKEISNEYAGMSLNRQGDSSAQRPAESVATPPTDTAAGDSMPSPYFLPTLQDPSREHEAQWGIEEDDPAGADPLSESTRLQQEQEYWERGLDVRMVYRYLRSRFSRRGYMPSDTHTSSQPRRPPQDASRRAAIIRHHHPLVAHAHAHSHSQSQSRRVSQFSGVSGPMGVSSPLLRQHLRRPGSSCASQSAKLSAISSRRTLTGSSRNYWDIGGSVESSSAIGVGAGLGTWGEV
ncbi:hypothetical protein NUU61_008661 [Penicillium alfredii]|uniref:Uncharacterized protein n=1 Tax=Penicillium alfredii TaxID=1506179 RepID=A0A9W9ELN3_9EURO|nr:uncharacterized protein NUU61_008661 [Penicillium alfredii]KAJ5084082.1 hypothetical protein NUU61_008661 [Penicillium alfredii]